jgi:hypothetical protein
MAAPGLILALALSLSARGGDEWGDPPPPAPAARFTLYSADGLGRRVTIGLPSGWTGARAAKDGALTAAVAAPAGSPDAGAFLALSAYPGRPVDRGAVPGVLAALARSVGFEPAADAERKPDIRSETIAGFEAWTLAGAGNGARGFVAALDIPGCAAVLVARANADRYPALEPTLRLAAHQVAVLGAAPPAPCRPVVLDPVAPPAAPLAGCFWAQRTELRPNFSTNVPDLVVTDTVYFFTAEGYVAEGLPDPGAPFDPVRASALAPQRVGTYQAREGGPLVLRFPGRAARTFGRWERRGTGLVLDGTRFFRADQDLGRVDLTGTYRRQSFRRMGNAAAGEVQTSVSSERTLRFLPGRRFERTGFVGLVSTAGLAGSHEAPIERGTYALGRGTIELRLETGAREIAWLRLDGDPGEKSALGAIAVGESWYLREE